VQVVSLKHLAPYRDESRDRKWFAPVLPTAGHSVGSKGKGKGKDKRDGDGKRTRDGERKAVTTSAEDAAAEHQAARLMSYEVPKVRPTYLHVRWAVGVPSASRVWGGARGVS
jgi:hypothetical protein